MDTSAEAKKIRKSVVKQFAEEQTHTLTANPIRAPLECAERIKKALQEAGINSDYYPLSATMGDVNPKIGIMLNGQEDPLEKDFKYIADALGLNPESLDYKKIREREAELAQQYYKQGMFYTTYDPTAKGSVEARTIIQKEAKLLGMNFPVDNIWMTDGGNGALVRIFETINWHIRQQKGRNAVLLAPQICFRMAPQAAMRYGMETVYIPTADLPNQQLTGKRIEEHFNQHPKKVDAIILTPADNPTTAAFDPPIFEEIVTTVLKHSPNTIFIIDDVYAHMISLEKSKALHQVLEKTGANKQTIYAFSESKHLAQPRTRIGAIVVPDATLAAVFHESTMSTYSSFSGVVDLYYQALMEHVSEYEKKGQHPLEDFVKLLKQRQQTLLTTIKQLDPNGKYFKDLDKVNNLDVPLYLWLSLQEGVNSFDIIEELNIVGVPSVAFGDTANNHIRFSVGGHVPTSDILRLTSNH